MIWEHIGAPTTRASKNVSEIRARSMRRAEYRMDDAEALRLLVEGDYGFLATADANNQPYVVPVNYAWDDGYLIIHSAPEGHKVENLRHNERVCFAICAEHEVVPDRANTRYRSVIAFGRAELVESMAQKRVLLEKLMQRLAPGRPFPCSEEELSRTAVIRVKVEHLAGKRNEGR